MITRCSVFIALLLALAAVSPGAQERIVFESSRDSDQPEIYVMMDGDVERLTFNNVRDLDPSLSPDGTKIAFYASVGRIFDIFVVDIEFGKIHHLPFSTELDVQPAWSPDGRKIAFSSNHDGDYDIYVMDADGQNEVQLTDNPEDDNWPDWSPDGRQIVFISEQDGGAAEVYILDVQSGQQRRLTDTICRCNYPKWSPDGTQIAFTSCVRKEIPPWYPYRQIWVMNTDGSDLLMLTRDEESNEEPAISPDGKQIAFVSRRDENVDIYSLDRDSKTVTRLTFDPGIDCQPDWSPDGKNIVFASKRADNYDVYVMDSRGGGEINLTRSEEAEIMPVWSPRGDKIAFAKTLETDEGIGRVIFVMDRDGSNQVKIGDFPSLYPAWSPEGDRIAFVSYPEHDVERCCICTVGVDGQDKQILYEEEAMIRGISWSADGKYIAFAHSRKEFEPMFQKEINLYLGVMLLDVVTGMAIEFDALSDRHLIDKVAWSSDGQEIVFSSPPPRLPSSERLNRGLFFIDSNGNIQRTIRERTEIPFGGRFAWSPDGQEILFGSNGNLYILDLATEGIELFMESAGSPDWKDPARLHSVTPQDKIITRWGKIKGPKRAGFLGE